MRKAIIAGIFLIISLTFLFLFSLPDRNFHLVFCDVGQGDAILASYGTFQMLVDGGPDSSVVNCLSRHMPFWDRKIDIVILTHPQEDHFGGLVDVVRRYRVGMFVRPEVEGESAGWQTLSSKLTSKNIMQNYANAGMRFRVSSLQFDILHPSASLKVSPSSDLNDYSIVGILSYGDFSALLTGDVVPPVTDELASRLDREVEVLKVPHHGSKNGLTPLFLERASPKLAVISVGKNNRFGHPHSEVIRLLGDWGVRTLRTDLDGEIETISDGKSYWTN